MTHYDFELAINGIPGLAWSADADGRVDFVNRPWLEYTGLERAAAIGPGWQQAIHPDDLPAFTEAWRTMVESGEAGAVEARVLRHDRNHRWFLFQAVPRYEHGRVVKWYGQTTDIEIRKRAELRRERESVLLGMVARGAPLEAVLHSICEQIEELVPGAVASILLFDAARNCLRHAAGPNLPRALIDHVDGRVLGTAGGPCGRAASTGKVTLAPDLSQTGLAAVLEGSGLRSACCTPILSSSARVLGTFALYFHHTGGSDSDSQAALAQLGDVASIAIERAGVLSSLSRAERYFAVAQRLSHTGSFSWSPRTGEVVWSDEVYRIYEIAEGVPVTLELAMTRVHPDDIEPFKRIVQRAMAARDDLHFEHRIVTVSGVTKFLEVHARAERDAGGDLDEYVGAVRDVTLLRQSEAALKRTQDELAHANRVATLGELTGSIAHELNQPLTGVGLNAKACLRWLGATPPDLKEAQLAAERIVRDTQRAADVIARLRAMFGKTEVAHQPVDIENAIREVLVLVRSELQRHRVEVEIDMAPALRPVLADKVQVQQVILNLLVNAIEALADLDERPREVRIIAHRSAENEVEVTVADSGPGIPPEHAARIFDAFYTNKSGGMGMGLAISKSIVERYGGRLWAAPGRPGAALHFTLPHCADPEGPTSGGAFVR